MYKNNHSMPSTIHALISNSIVSVGPSVLLMTDMLWQQPLFSNSLNVFIGSLNWNCVGEIKNVVEQIYITAWKKTNSLFNLDANFIRYKLQS